MFILFMNMKPGENKKLNKNRIMVGRVNARNVTEHCFAIIIIVEVYYVWYSILLYNGYCGTRM